MGAEIAKQKTGSVKWYNKQKGYGFITKDDGTGDCYVHFSGLTKGNRELQEGDQVEFLEVAGQRGPKAIEVHKI